MKQQRSALSFGGTIEVEKLVLGLVDVRGDAVI
jgi:hypothetical protein